VCGSGIGNEIQRKGSKVLLCFWQCGQVREDLWGKHYISEYDQQTLWPDSLAIKPTYTAPETIPAQTTQQKGEEMAPLCSGHLHQ